MRYIILNDNSPIGLVEKVETYLKMGYVCQGGLCADRIFGFSQAMIKN